MSDQILSNEARWHNILFEKFRSAATIRQVLEVLIKYCSCERDKWKKKRGKGWKHKRNYSPLNSNGNFTLVNSKTTHYSHTCTFTVNCQEPTCCVTQNISNGVFFGATPWRSATLIRDLVEPTPLAILGSLPKDTVCHTKVRVFYAISTCSSRK
jgi:hypothetical protein